ncbi:amidohydrolase [Bacteroides sp. 224]|uniref:amidohydrolase n=1 Tax=Bacteroides sp. 224 TaxID=2302936 RepID=UPI0013D547C3|nr:amidohydrolase [Bacteroides sp. 224]NDV65938.1 amidohydrolase [Bacteroides sp. 224]
MRVTILQTDISWENKQENLLKLQKHLEKLRGTTNLVVLPEMFSTGFSMNSRQLAEPIDGPTIQTLREWAIKYQTALTGSYIASDSNHFYNRGFFLTPDGQSYFYDKKHLFRMGEESNHFAAGNKRLIIPYMGWNICLLICYDLRFPVWARNTHNEYDLLLYTANWPDSRHLVWDTLLPARALENMSYVCGVNRVGTDGNNLIYSGGSKLYSAKGELLAAIPDHKEDAITVELSLSSLQQFRNKFPVWKDADEFKFC